MYTWDCYLKVDFSRAELARIGVVDSDLYGEDTSALPGVDQGTICCSAKMLRRSGEKVNALNQN